MENKNYFSELKKRKNSFFRPTRSCPGLIYCAGLLFGLMLATSCMDKENDPYVEEPVWLGGSIYDYLDHDGNFTFYLKLIDDLEYKEVLQLTGSKTLFAVKDSAFLEFFKENPWGVKNYEQLTQAQKKLLFKYSMINNAYLIERLSNYYSGTVYYEGEAMRRITALDPLDSLFHGGGNQIPEGPYWNRHKEKGIYLLKDNSDIPMVFFSQQFIDKFQITAEDFSFLSGGKTRSYNDFHVFNKKVIQRDIVCKNGYIHILEGLVIPPVNMAEYIATNPNTKIFSKLLDRFSAPYYNDDVTRTYRALHPEFQDSVFTKRYYANRGGTSIKPDGKNAPYRLPFNPGWNAYGIASIYPDMAAMFVPTDEVMSAYFNADPTGVLLKQRYGEWDALPEDVAISFLRRHMRASLVESVPSRFSKMVDEENYQLPVTTENILKQQNYTAVNGEVYVTNKVYTPVDFISVYGPVLLSEDTKIMNWAISRTISQGGATFAFYKLYLNSLVVKYGLFIPTDEYLHHYIDPVAYGQLGTQGVLKYWINDKTSAVNATVYTYSKATGEVGDSVNVITNEAFLQDRLWKLLDSHIVVGDIKGDGYYVTKANDIFKVSGSGTQIQGGYNLENNTTIDVIKKYPQENGNTYLLNAPIQSTFKSVYSILANVENSDFSDFLELLDGVPSEYKDEIPPIFSIKGIDKVVTFFNAYNYTVYVPTNEAIQAAIQTGKIKTWEEINRLTGSEHKAETLKLVRFLRYHFQDRAIFVGQDINDILQSSTLKLPTDTFDSHFKTTNNKYYKLGVKNVSSSEGPTIEITTENQKTARVKLKPGCYNIIAKDYVFSDLPSKYKNVDGTGATNAGAFSNSTITSSSSAVIHLIDNILTFD